MHSNNNSLRRVLPPGIDEDEIVFGIMWIRIGNLRMIRGGKEDYKIILQFWGETQESILSIKADTPLNSETRLQEYDIKCPATFFEKYLLDMKNNFKLQVEGVGRVTLDISKFLKDKIQLSSKSVFDHFKGFFEVLNKHNKKVGSLQIEMASTFNPQIAIRQFGETEANPNPILKNEGCPASQMNHSKVCLCEGKCKCLPTSKVAVDVIAVEKPELLKEFFQETKQKKKEIKKEVKDDRIPNSLNTKLNQIKEFNPTKYIEEQPKPISIKVQVSDKSPKIKKFPTVQKILTYSNLRLNYEDEEQEPKKEPTKKNVVIIEEQKQFPSTKMVPIIEKKDDLISQFYGPHDPPAQIKQQIIEEDKISRLSEVRRLDRSQSEDAHKDMLSRVVNLNQELEKELIQNVSLKKEPHLFSEQKENYSRNQRPSHHSFLKNLQKEVRQVKNIRPATSTQPFRKKSSLLLNLIAQIDTESVILADKSKFILAHRPYGQKDRVKLGPTFGKKILIMNPIGQAQLNMMGKTELILQFWNANNDSFQGLIRINLSKIKKGFLLDGRINEIAVKTNLMPTIIHKGAREIIGLDERGCGSCWLSAFIGTSSQIDYYMNSSTENAVSNGKFNLTQNQIKKQSDIIKKQPQILKEKKPQGNLGAASLDNFTDFLHFIDENNDKLINQLTKIMAKPSFNQQEFTQFLSIIQFKFNITPFLVRESQILSSDISQSFKDYKEIKDEYSIVFRKLSKKIAQTIQSKGIINNIKSESSFNLISKEKLKQMLIPILNADELQLFLTFYNDHINIDSIYEQSAKYLPINSMKFKDEIVNYFLKKCKQLEINCETCAANFANTATVDALMIKKQFKNKISLWLIQSIFERIKDYFNERDNKFQQISLPSLYNWLKLLIKEDSIDIQDEHLHPQQNLEHHETNVILESPIKPQQRQPQKNMNNQQQIGQVPQNIHSNNLNPSQIHQNTINQVEQSSFKYPKMNKHTFMITPTNLILQTPYSGDCIITYTFPHEQEHVSSKKIQLFNDKHKYQIQSVGTHIFIIQDSINEYLHDTFLRFRVIVKGKIELEGDLHSDELMIGNGKTQTRILPLFSDNVERIAGKIKLNIHYESKQTDENKVGKETIYNVFLPKSGFINFEIESKIDIHKIKHQLNLKQEFYLSIAVDIFHEMPKLRDQFPPISSKLYSDYSNPLSVKSSIKLSLNQIILDYFKIKNALISLIVVYYSKQKGNFHKKELVYAHVKIPLLSIIKEEGIHGDYAFKNKLGMFVALIKSQIKYEKDPKIDEAIDENQHSVNHRRDNYWILIEFLQLINFEREQVNHIKFEFVHLAKKYSTDRINLHGETYNDLKNETILMHLNEEDFNSTKILPITIISNNQRLAVDINLKAIAKQLSKQKYSINSQYFLIVDGGSKCKKMRLGMKIGVFRGSILLGNFIQDLKRNAGYDVFSQMQMPKQIDNYNKMCQIFKSMLKISNKNFEQVLSMLLNNKKRQKLNLQIFTNQIQFRLDFTPIIAQNESDIDAICAELPTEIDKEAVLQYLKSNEIDLINLRPEFLQRFAFKQLNSNRLDKNVEFLDIHNQIDLITFIRKLKIHSDTIAQNLNNQTASHEQQLKIQILKGHNFQYLYNGVKPNVQVRLPQLGFETAVISRASDPNFNQTFKDIVDEASLHNLRKLKVEVYHVGLSQGQEEFILIGQGYSSIIETISSKQVPNAKIYKFVIDSLMSSKMKASLEVKIELGPASKERQFKEDQSELQKSHQASNYEDMMRKINNSMKNKDALFESSDDD